MKFYFPYKIIIILLILVIIAAILYGFTMNTKVEGFEKSNTSDLINVSKKWGKNIYKH
jgi:hypothetical protein